MKLIGNTSFEIQDGRSAFVQWDLDRKLIVNIACDEVHMSNDCKTAPVLIPYEENGQRVVNVPNIFLQKTNPIDVYAVVENRGVYTKRKMTFSVHPRPKPDDYVYTETEVRTWEDLDERLKAAVKTVNGVSPDENGNVEVDALPDDTEQLEMLIEADLLPAVYDASGAILTDENGKVILRY